MREVVLRCLAFVFLVGLIQSIAISASAGTVQVDSSFQGLSTINDVVAPGQVKTFPIGTMKSGDKLGAQVDAANKVFNDITACIATEEEARAYTPKSACKGQSKGRTPIVLKEDIASDANYVLILDNSYALLTKKPVTISLVTRRSLSPEEVNQIKGGLQSVQSMMEATFEGSDFNLFVKPCGQANAFSANATADITYCTEMLHELATRRNQGAILAILLHEYGHSLLNRWGEPGSSEEDMADQFAIAMLLRAGDRGRALLQEWISFWAAQDSRAEAAAMLRRNNTHSLSIQRARNIQGVINVPEDFQRRWNKMLYRHMKKDALAKIVAKPSKADDVELAQDALKGK